MKTFDHHWNQHSFREIPATKKADAQRFLKPLFNYLKNHDRALMLDAGCGDGVHVNVLSNDISVSNGHFFIGVDISLLALHISQHRQQANWQFVQSDIGKMSFKDNQFDVVFSFGVLAYTDDPFLSFTELCRITRPGGYIGIWIYPKTGGLGGALLAFVRRVCQLTGSIGCRIIADAIVPFLSFLPTQSKLSLMNASWWQCREVVLVNIAPSQLYYPESSEVEGWFARNNINIITRNDETPITLWGKKC